MPLFTEQLDPDLAAEIKRAANVVLNGVAEGCRRGLSQVGAHMLPSNDQLTKGRPGRSSLEDGVKHAVTNHKAATSSTIVITHAKP